MIGYIFRLLITNMLSSLQLTALTVNSEAEV